MPKQSRPDDQKDMPNQAANKEPADGSRETVEGGDEGRGITNRPWSEEVNQDRVPPRGENKEGGHA